jgi:hypothetical protein
MQWRTRDHGSAAATTTSLKRSKHAYSMAALAAGARVNKVDLAKEFRVT